MSALATSELELPAFVPPEEMRVMSAMKLFEVGRLSLGQAALMAGYSKRGFMDLLSHHSVAVVDYPASELAAEVEW